MNLDTKPYLKKFKYTDYLGSLNKACEWIGIPNHQVRAAQYSRLIKEFFEDNMRSPQHILAYNESWEIVYIYELWKECIYNFPSLEQKIREAFTKGPVLSESERPDASSNRPRNDAFVYFLAGKLLKAGLKVIAVDGMVAQGTTCHKDADITIDWHGSVIDIECKRPQSSKAFEKRIKEAARQLIDLRRQGRKGIIGIDCSALIRPSQNLLESDSSEHAEQFLSDLLEERVNKVMPKVNKYLKTHILGFLVFARVPSMIRTKSSPILSSRGTPFTYLRPESTYTLQVIPNPNSLNINMLKSIYKQLRQSL